MTITVIQSSLEDGRLFRQFVEQLEKDFETAGIDGGFAAKLEPSYQRILSVVTAVVARAAEMPGRRIEGLLNRVDITEKQLHKAMEEGEGSFEERISELVIRRELQKIMIRNKFSE